MMKRECINLNEFESEAGERLFSYVASWLKEEKIEKVSIVGSDRHVKCLTEAMTATRVFHDELHKEDATLDSISEKLEKKHVAAKKFESVFGVAWKL